MTCKWRSAVAAVALAILSVCGSPASAAHSAWAFLAGDPSGAPPYAGTSHPPGAYDISLNVASPAYLNTISGGGNGGAWGEATIRPIDFFNSEAVALAIHVTDTAGASHSLSALNDPALADIVADLNVNPPGVSPFTAFSYKSAPAQYAAIVAALSAGEAANGGQQFDILLFTPNTTFSGGGWLAMNFSGELGNLDGITALNVTDIGATPEPSSAALLVLFGTALLARRRRA